MLAPSITPRLQYIADFIGNELFDVPLRITTRKHEYQMHEGPRINYTAEETGPDELQIVPHALLFETGVRTQQIVCFELNYHKAFFETGGDLRFDVFAASFYLISRYEEYLPHEKDEYGRFSHESSLAYRESFLHLPLINIWLMQFRNALMMKFPGLVLRGKHFSNLVTYDVDMAYSYRHKGLIRNIGGTLRSIWQGQWRLAFERWEVLAGKRKDPFDCFEWLDALHLYCRVKPYYFFLVARQSSRYDKNVDPSSKPFRRLIEYYASAFNVGIHPSWRSGDDASVLNEEIEWLETVSEKPIVSGRQHYLRFTLPETYRVLASAGISRDFSMGYGGANGFRASVCSCFPWYDLSREETTGLIVYPFCYMDSVSFFVSRKNPKQAYEELMEYYEAVKRVNGMLITIWHNHLLGADPKTRGWREMFELFMKQVVYWDAYYDGSAEIRPEKVRQ